MTIKRLVVILCCQLVSNTLAFLSVQQCKPHLLSEIRLPSASSLYTPEVLSDGETCIFLLDY
jgi:hypothetical protein